MATVVATGSLIVPGGDYALRSKDPDILRKYALRRHNEKLAKHQKIHDKAQLSVGTLDAQVLFWSGLSLYWAEGFKNINEQRVGFCNSDPRMIRFIMRWFRESLNITDDDFTLRAEFNIDHRNRLEEIESHWSEVTGIPLDQFNKPYLQTAKLSRKYKNMNSYYGVLRIRIRKSSELLTKIRGWIEGLSLATTSFPKEL